VLRRPVSANVERAWPVLVGSTSDSSGILSRPRTGSARIAPRRTTGWKRPFDDPIPLPRGRQLVTLEDAATYIMKLPKAEQALEEWQTAVACLIGAAEGRDFVMHARIGVLRALNRNVERTLTRARTHKSGSVKRPAHVRKRLTTAAPRCGV
jgi:hypothetical protein